MRHIYKHPDVGLTGCSESVPQAHAAHHVDKTALRNPCGTLRRPRKYDFSTYKVVALFEFHWLVPLPVSGKARPRNISKTFTKN
jgi:hypothetical protein